MPQDGSNNYQYPPGTPGIPDTTIESEAYNTFLDDLVTNDLNIARPVHRGGTGAINALDARNNLDAEYAMATVTNYDSHAWENGSFWSAVSATGGPPAPGRTFVGTCFVGNNDPQFIRLEVKSLNNAGTPVVTFFRQKINGVWEAWSNALTAGGDVIFGSDVTVNGGDMQINSLSSASFVLNKSPGAFSNNIIGKMNDTLRWDIQPGDSAIEGGGNVGSNFSINRYDNGGTFAGQSLLIDRNSGFVHLENGLSTKAHIQAGAVSDVGAVYFGTGGTARVDYAAGAFSLLGGPLTIAGAPTAGGHVANKTYVDTKPGAIRAGALINASGGQGFSYGIGTVVDFAVGVTDVVYSFSFSSSFYNVPVAQVYGNVGPDTACNVGMPSPNSVRIHSIVASTGALGDPLYYTLQVIGGP